MLKTTTRKQRSLRLSPTELKSYMALLRSNVFDGGAVAASNGNLLERRFSNGQKVVCSYDTLNRLKTREAYANGDLLQSFLYSYDKVGNLIFSNEKYAMDGVPNRAVNLNYDNNYRLSEEIFVTEAPVGPNGNLTILTPRRSIQTTKYDYDAAHNRISKEVVGGEKPEDTTSQYNQLNQLVSFTDNLTQLTADFEYDVNGNRTKRTSSEGEITQYSYDPDNRLTGVVEAGRKREIDILGPDHLKTKTTYKVDGNYNYTYDYRTRRISRNESGVKTDIVFLGGTSVLEFEGSENQAPNRAAGSVPTVEYVRGSDLGGGIGGILYSLRDGQPSFTWYNNRGDVVAKTDNTGALTYQAAYEAFGSRTAEGGHTQDRQRANTREETAWGGLYENMRWRDIETGAYLTRDPAGFVDGPNLYAYVRQNPWSRFDPLGLFYPDDTYFGNDHVGSYQSMGADPQIKKAFKALGEIAVGFIPWVGDAHGGVMDVKDLTSSSSSKLDKTIAGASITANGVTLGASPNLGPIVRGLDDLADAFTDAPFDEMVKKVDFSDVVDSAQKLEKPNKPDYTQIPDPKKVDASTKPTPRQVEEMKRLNKESNGGVMRDDVTGEVMVPSKKSESGVTPPQNEVQVDHINPVDNGGTRTMENLELRTRKNNRKKSNNTN